MDKYHGCSSRSVNVVCQGVRPISNLEVSSKEGLVSHRAELFSCMGLWVLLLRVESISFGLVAFERLWYVHGHGWAPQDVGYAGDGKECYRGRNQI